MTITREARNKLLAALAQEVANQEKVKTGKPKAQPKADAEQTAALAETLDGLMHGGK